MKLAREDRLTWCLFMSAGMLLALFGCAAPSDSFDRSIDIPMREEWASPADAGVPISSDWWKSLADEQLVLLVEEALVYNVDLRAAGARLLAADAAARVEGAARLPNAQLSLSADRSKRSFLGFPSLGPGGGTATSRSTIYGLGLSTSWELDLWSRLANRERAADQDALAVWADYAYGRVSLAAAVLQAWFSLVEAEQQVELAEQTQKTWEENDTLVRRRYEQGLRPALDARLVTVDLERARAEVVRLLRLRTDAARELELLLGRYPSGELAAANDLPAPVGPVPSGMPSTLIARRADLFAAERRLAAAESRVDAAREDFYPRFALTGDVGTSSEYLSDLLDGNFGVWRLLGSVVQPVFEGGRLQASLDGAEAQAGVQLAVFAGKVLDALAEVEGALSDEQRFAEELVLRTRVAEEARAASQLARRRYSEGLAEVTTMLDAQRNAYVADSALLALRGLRLGARIRLHLALGGGFSAKEAPHSAALARQQVLGVEQGNRVEAERLDEADVEILSAKSDHDENGG
ncbi:MAG: efflux transporter outer membrane subunit [Planctomycetota bacterium]|nr:efflux transporter outer membrane subunit [Planctomycetota bacterium]